MASTHNSQHIWPAPKTMAHVTTTALQPQSRLLSVVPELRTKIFEYALEEVDPIIVILTAQNFRTTSGRKRIRYSLSPTPPFLLISKQIRSEAQGIFWTCNTFLFNDLTLNYKAIKAFNYVTLPFEKHMNKAALSRSVRVPIIVQNGAFTNLVFPLHNLEFLLNRKDKILSITPIPNEDLLSLSEDSAFTIAPCLFNLRTYLKTIGGSPLMVAMGNLVAHINDIGGQQARGTLGQGYWCATCRGVIVLCWRREVWREW
ncbi:hypothetical protein LTR95_000819 [Oleoguttula sp. CCFEE 5521]